jgi:hypothetical protein
VASPQHLNLIVRPDFAPVLRQLRNQKGQFSKQVQSQIAKTHAEAASQVAEAMAEVLDAKANARAGSTGFPRRNARHLTRALVDWGNMRGAPNPNWVWGFEVGIPEFLDNYTAGDVNQFWQRLEEGEASFPVRSQHGAFKGRLLRFYGPRFIRSFRPPRRVGDELNLGNAFAKGGSIVEVGRVRPGVIPAYRYMRGGAVKAERKFMRNNGAYMKSLYRDVGGLQV